VLGSGIRERGFEAEFVFIASRSSGPGGQHVNKVSTRIELRLDIPGSKLLKEEEKLILMDKLANRISKEGIIILASQSGRSQYNNRTEVTERFYKLVEKALTPAKRRRPTRPTNASKIKRLESKQLRSEKKLRRKSLPEE
jgi:ribosome-associated protein